MSYHDLLTMYGSEQETAEQRVYIYVQQPRTLETPHDVACRDGQVAVEIKRLESMIDDLRDYRVALAQRYAELETMPYTRVLPSPCAHCSAGLPATATARRTRA